MSQNNRLELTWVGKEKRTQVEPRILLDDPSLSYHAPARKSAADEFDNLLAPKIQTVLSNALN